MLSPEGLGGHHLLSQTEPCRPAGEVMRHHLGDEPGSGPLSVNRPAGLGGPPSRTSSWNRCATGRRRRAWCCSERTDSRASATPRSAARRAGVDGRWCVGRSVGQKAVVVTERVSRWLMSGGDFGGQKLRDKLALSRGELTWRNSLVEVLSGVVRLALTAGVGWLSVAGGRVWRKLCHPRFRHTHRQHHPRPRSPERPIWNKAKALASDPMTKPAMLRTR